jgi:hypothetical protein
MMPAPTILSLRASKGIKIPVFVSSLSNQKVSRETVVPTPAPVSLVLSAASSAQ